MPIGKNEVKITNAYTVEAGHEASGKHDPTPNWTERGPALVAPENFRLRIDAEVGSDLGNSNWQYDVVIQAACLTNPLAKWVLNLDEVLTGPTEAFSNAGGWEYDASEDKYMKSWSVHFPIAGGPLFASAVFPFSLFNQVDEIWQFFVSIRDTVGDGTGNKRFGCTFASERFSLLAP